MSTSLILGIDPGTCVTGYAVVGAGRGLGVPVNVIDSGVIKLDTRADLAQRLADLQKQISDIVTRHAPATAAVEDVFSHRNARSALLLGHARGAVLAAVAAHGLSVQAYAPAMVKRAMAGHGRADKGQMQRMAQAMTGLDRLPLEDEADAIAVAACHAMNQRVATCPVVPAGGRGRARNSRRAR